MFTFVHAADIHLDSPLKGLFQYEGAPDVDEIRVIMGTPFSFTVYCAKGGVRS